MAVLVIIHRRSKKVLLHQTFGKDIWINASSSPSPLWIRWPENKHAKLCKVMFAGQFLTQLPPPRPRPHLVSENCRWKFNSWPNLTWYTDRHCRPFFFLETQASAVGAVGWLQRRIPQWMQGVTFHLSSSGLPLSFLRPKPDVRNRNRVSRKTKWIKRELCEEVRRRRSAETFCSVSKSEDSFWRWMPIPNPPAAPPIWL